MSQKRILAFSSSRVGNSGYLEAAAPVIRKFLGEQSLNIAFIPFASVPRNDEGYLSMVKEGLKDLPHNIELAQQEVAAGIIEQSDVIMVGGGNTFKLLHHIYSLELLEVIRKKVLTGTPYIGWSAGSNITGTTIGTTNDMPIVQPKSFNALAFFPFQINPHYINQPVQGFNGETRDQRLTEYMLMNPRSVIVCLPEGTALHLEDTMLTYEGGVNGVLFESDVQTGDIIKTEIEPGKDISYLM